MTHANTERALGEHGVTASTAKHFNIHFLHSVLEMPVHCGLGWLLEGSAMGQEKHLERGSYAGELVDRCRSKAVTQWTPGMKKCDMESGSLLGKNWKPSRHPQSCSYGGTSK
jgi:hypothetical protein